MTGHATGVSVSSNDHRRFSLAAVEHLRVGQTENAAEDRYFWESVDRRAPGGRARKRRTTKRPRLSGASEARVLWETTAGRYLIGGVLAIAVATVVGLTLLWPSAPSHGPTNVLGVTSTVKVLRVIDGPCSGGPSCRRIVAQIGRQSVPITIGPIASAPTLTPGERVRVGRTPTRPGVQTAPISQQYSFVDVARGRSLTMMLIALAVLAGVLLRWRGLFAFVGLAISVFVAVAFVVPAVLAGESALLVALVASVSVTFVTLLLTHGIGVQTLAAAVGISTTLMLVCGLAVGLSGASHLTGLSNDASLVLQERDRTLSLQGVVVAGMVIGALGVLVDTAVTQASAVMALRRTDPQSSAKSLRDGATAVGRDHLSATIHTLVLAYVGASLPFLLAMRSTGLGFADAINTETVAEPVVAAIVGCGALLLAVPVTTWLASALACRLPVEVLPEGHSHAH